jgi:hypothetical protein
MDIPKSELIRQARIAKPIPLGDNEDLTPILQQSLEKAKAGRSILQQPAIEAPSGKIINPLPRAQEDIATDAELSALGKARDAGDFTDKTIPIGQLRTRQPYIEAAGGKSAGKIPEGYRTQSGEYIVLDGNNRIADAIKRGDTSARIRVWNTGQTK